MMPRKMPREEYLKLPLRDRLIKLSKSEEERVERILEKAVLVDMHTHITDNFSKEGVENSRVTCFFEAVAAISEDFYEALHKLGETLSFVRKNTHLEVAFRAEDIERAKKEGKQVIMVQLEPIAIGRDLDRINLFYGLGVRMMMLTFNSRNYIGDGCAERTDSGLSYFGLEVVGRMNELGILIDVAHCGDKTSIEAAEASKDPVVCSHSGARALYPKCKRLKSDEALKAVAEKGGVVGVFAVPNALSNKERQGLEDVLNHIDYIVNLVGVNHVAIGTDIIFGDHVAFHRELARRGVIDPSRVGMELVADYMEGIENPEEWTNIVRGLVLRGYSDEEIMKIVGGNALRVMKRVLRS
ncbi:MAG: membrane dipeptidase [Desulfurococcaceae archaeon]